MAVYQEPAATRRIVSFGVVAGLHGLVIALLLSQTGTLQLALPRVLQAVRILPPRPSKPPPADLLPVLKLPDLAPIRAPDVEIAQPANPRAPRAIVPVARPSTPPGAAHFGPATGDAGLGVEAATTAGGGAGGRGSLADFQAAVRRAVLARRVQPSLAWDRRRTCVINYTVSVGSDGSLAGLSIDPCAVPEINAAAEAAIRAAAPFPAPPALGASRAAVHGTLIFGP